MLPGADHALEVEGNVAATVAGLSALADAALDFLVAPGGPQATADSRDEQGCRDTGYPTPKEDERGRRRVGRGEQPPENEHRQT